MSIFSKIKQSFIYKILKTLKIIDFLIFLISRWNDFIRVLRGPTLRDFFLSIHILLYCMVIHAPRKAPKRAKNRNQKRTLPLIISLTTYPARMKTVYLTLFTLIRQKEVPDAIVLWLSREECKSQSKFPLLFRMLCRRGISIEWVEDVYSSNCKVYNKLLPSLKKFPDSLIVVCDDDVLYPRWWLAQLYQAHLNTPDTIIGHKGMYLTLKNKQSLNTFNDMVEDWVAEWKKAIKPEYREELKSKYMTPSHHIFLEGVGGILFPPNVLPDEIHKKEKFIELSPFADDIWFNAMAILHNTKRSAISSHFHFVPKSIHGTQDIGLYTFNINQGLNDTQLKAVFDAYHLYKHLR